MVLLCWPSGEVGGPPDTTRGIVLQIVSSTSYAGHILLLSRYGKGAPAVPFCLWQLVVVAVAATVMALLPGGGAEQLADAVWTPALLGAIAYLGVLATALGIGVQSKVQHRIPPNHLALLFALQPLFAALIGWLVMSDRLGAAQLAGGMVIVAGVVVSSRER
jgi:drug/metabolite transporter (DMT)-like permease